MLPSLIALLCFKPCKWSQPALTLLIAGAIAICAMILPGISGSFIYY
ncbi:DUF368 domain-containing protein [Vibrio lentus]|nr:DUF368 domain-containing protein [Vibrio lentus]